MVDTIPCGAYCDGTMTLADGWWKCGACGYKKPIANPGQVEQSFRLSDRALRAEDVVRDYEITPIGPNAFVVTHPDCQDDPECGRSYLVDTAARTCACPDYQTRHEAEGPGFECKHLIGLRILEDRNAVAA